MQNEITEKEIYTSLEEAKDEIWRRWNDNDLRKKVEAYCGEVPSVLKNEPRAVLFRHLMSPNYECMYFFDLARTLQLKPLGWEYLDDIFLTINKDKAYLGKMGFINYPININNIRYSRVLSLNENEKIQFTRIKTLWGESFVDFHHRMLAQKITGIHLFDASQWCASKGGKAKEYYQYFIALFICHGLFFENFIMNGEEERFSKSVVFPAFKQVVEHFGVKPLIVPLVPREQASDIYWRCYPAELEAEVSRCLSQYNAKDSSSHRHAGRYVGKDSGHHESRK